MPRDIDDRNGAEVVAGKWDDRLKAIFCRRARSADRLSKPGGSYKTCDGDIQGVMCRSLLSDRWQSRVGVPSQRTYWIFSGTGEVAASADGGALKCRRGHTRTTGAKF